MKIDFAFQQDLNSQSSFVVNLTATNSTSSAMTDFLFQSAVPKVCAASVCEWLYCNFKKCTLQRVVCNNNANYGS